MDFVADGREPYTHTYPIIIWRILLSNNANEESASKDHFYKVPGLRPLTEFNRKDIPCMPREDLVVFWLWRCSIQGPDADKADETAEQAKHAEHAELLQAKVTTFRPETVDFITKRMASSTQPSQREKINGVIAKIAEKRTHPANDPFPPPEERK